MGSDFRILVTDDDPVILSLTASVLRGAGYEVLEASTGMECLELVHAHHPDLILLDIILPDVMGLELCRQVKTDKDLQGIFVILLSGIQTSSDYQADGLNVGADGYIIKPIPNKELVARVKAMERIKRAEDALRETQQRQGQIIVELEKALAEVKTLRGLIPICASCKKIRDDKGYWNQIEAYISKHTDAVFTHGLCPDCEKVYRAEMDRAR
jgi:DNA-binding response OmpR family regulator